MNFYEQILHYEPWNDQEAQDKKLILQYLKTEENLYTRENERYHFTASPWIINHDNTKVLMVHHNIYQSWGWCGGHADGDENLLQVAIKEGKEETGLQTLTPYLNTIFAIDILPVPFHYKRGKAVEIHQHINITYLCIADESEQLQHRPDENSGVMWINKEMINHYVNEELMKPVYEKLKKKTNLMYKVLKWG